MSAYHAPLTRRRLLQSASLLPLLPLAARASREAAAAPKTSIPYVDGLCFNIFDQPDEIRASGLSALILDVSDFDTITAADGSETFQRSFNSCMKAMVSARQKLRSTQNVFLATNGSEVRAAHRNDQTAVFLQLQGGGEVVGEDLSRIDLCHELGLRVLQLTHHTNNLLAGGSLDRAPAGLTRLGYEAVERMNALGVIPDIAHASDRTSMDVLKASKTPVILSHGAARALVNSARCSPDDVIRGIAKSGGVMGIFMMSFWLTAEAEPSIDCLIAQIRHAVNVGGIDSVGIANDYPLSGEPNLVRSGINREAAEDCYAWWDSMARQGALGFDKRPVHVAIPELNNIHRMTTIHRALEISGFRPSEVEKIMGGNWVRVLTEAVR